MEPNRLIAMRSVAEGLRVDGMASRSECVIELVEAVANLQAEVARLTQRNTEHEQFRHQHRDCDTLSCENQGLRLKVKAMQSWQESTALLIEECRGALSIELTAWDIDPPLHHVKQAHDKCTAWLAQSQPQPTDGSQQ